jgi:P pilus assembly chaperone PapD
MRIRAAKVAACFSVLLALLFAVPALALMVRPVVVELSSSGGGANGSLEVVNDRNRPVTVEVKVQKLTLPQRGDPVLTPDSGADFLIFPPIASIKPGARQVLRVRYIGPPDIPATRLYMFATSELPVAPDPTEKRAQVQVLYSINSVVAVTPPEAKPDIKIAAVERAKNAKGEPGLYVMFENDGAAHGFVGNGTLELTSGAWHKEFGQKQVGEAFGLGLVPAQAKRDMFIPIADVPATGSISGDIKLER